MLQQVSGRRRGPVGGFVLVVVTVVALLVGMAVGFTGCGGSSLQGTWLASDGSETVVVTSDKISVDTGGTTMDFTYKVDGDNLVITMEGLGSMEVPYKLDGDSLTLSMEGGDSMTYSRQ